jgi:hypothetical protein
MMVSACAATLKEISTATTACTAYLTDMAHLAAGHGHYRAPAHDAGAFESDFSLAIGD